MPSDRLNRLSALPTQLHSAARYQRQFHVSSDPLMFAISQRVRYAAVVSEQPQHSLTVDHVRHVAKLSRLAISETELDLFRRQLGAVLEYVAKINELQLDGIEPLAHPIGITNQMDDDVSQRGLTEEQVLRNAPAVKDQYFSVPKVLGEGGG